MRLTVCFLASLLVPSNLTAQEGDTRQIGRWHHTSKIDPITDANVSEAFTIDDDQRWYLGFGCADGDLMVIVAPTVPSENLRRTWSETMTWRVDRNEPVSEKWILVAQGLALQAEGATRLAEAMMQGEERIALRFGRTAQEHTLVLSLDGAREAIGAMNACN